MAISTYLSIVTLNVNGLNAPIKRHRVTEWIKKQHPSICCLHLKPKDIHRLKVKGWKKIFHANNRGKKTGVAVLVSDKIDFKTKKVTSDKEGHYIMIKGSLQQDDITIINIYAPNTGAHTYMKQILSELKRGNRMQRIHSISPCLLIGTFRPFTFRVIINRYILIAIAGFGFVVMFKGSFFTL